MFGKEKCKMLKEIRAEIAKNNDIEFVTKECTHQGKCKGTCPACEAEVAYLEEQLEKRKALGKAVCVAGLSAAMVAGVVQTNQANGKTSEINSSTCLSGPTEPTMGVIPITPDPTLTPTPEMPAGAPYIPDETTTPDETVAPSPSPTMEMPAGVPYIPDETETPEVTESAMPTPEMPTEVPLPMGTAMPMVTATPTIVATPTPTSDFYTATPSASVDDSTDSTTEPTEEPKEMATPTPTVEPTQRPQETAKPFVQPSASVQVTTTPTSVPTQAVSQTASAAPSGQPQSSSLPSNGTTNHSSGKEEKYKITWVYNDGTALQRTLEYQKDTQIGELPVLTRKGYLLAGWYTEEKGGTEVSATEHVVSNQTFYAHWTKVTIKKTKISKVRYHKNNGLQVAWNATNSADGYIITTSTSSTMKKNKKTKDVSKSQRKIVLDYLAENKTYYISVIAYRYDSDGNKVYGKCQKIKRIRIK